MSPARVPIAIAAVLVISFWSLPATSSAQTPVIQSPPAVLAAGPDFATDVLGNAWDFADAQDLSPFPDDIRGWTISASRGRSIGRAAYLDAGKFVGTTTPGGENLVTLLYRGGQPWVPSERDVAGVLDHNAIPTHRFGKLSIAMTVTSAAAQMAAFAWPTAYLGPNLDAHAVIFNVPRPGTHVYTVDLADGTWMNEHGTPGAPTMGGGGGWNGVSLMRGFGLRPSLGGNSVGISIDWVRLTQRDGLAGAAMVPLRFTGCANQQYSVEVSGAGTSAQVIHAGTAGAAGNTTANVNYGVLPPGTWNFQVRCFSGARGGPSTVSTAASIVINQPPVVTIHNPDAFGGADFATDVLGNPWDMNAMTDIKRLFHVTDAGIVSDPPTNALQATADSRGDPIVELLNNTASIDTTRYRNLTFTLTLDTPFGLDGNAGDGSVARVIWSNPSTQPSGTRDILVWPGRNVYTIDLSQLTVANGRLEPESPLRWGAAPVSAFRIDPHESTKNVRFRLGPTYITAPDEVVLGRRFNVQYSFVDADTTGSTYEARIYRANSRGGALRLIDTVTNGVVPNQVLHYQLDPQAAGRELPPGEYFLYVEISELRHGIRDTRGMYAGGALRVLATAPPSSAAPGPPTLVAVQGRSNPIVIGWSAGLGAPPTSYTVAAGSAPGASNLGVFGVGLQTTVSGNVPTNIPVYIRVTAHNAHGSATSNEIIVQIGGGGVTPPAPPVLSASQVATNPVTLSWAAGSGGAGTSYTVVAGTAPGGANLGTFPMGTATSITAVAPEGLRIYVRVIASNAAGRATSNEVNFQVGGATVPGVPTLHAPSITGSTVHLSWTPPASGGPAASYVLLARSSPSGPFVAVLPVSGTSFTTVAPRGTYYVTVVASNGAGQSRESNQVTVVVP